MCHSKLNDLEMVAEKLFEWPWGETENMAPCKQSKQNIFDEVL